jgi:hypothetical protein
MEARVAERDEDVTFVGTTNLDRLAEIPTTDIARRSSAAYDGYNLDMAVDLFEELDIVDVGDVFVIPPTSRRPSTRSTRPCTTSPRPAPSRSSSAATTRSANPT